MRVVADENIPFAREAFGRLGDVTLCAGRRMSAATVRDADALFVRSVTRINEALLAESSVKFVGTATIGTDHVDGGYLRDCGIGFAYAPGCNAMSVAEYVVAAMLVLAGRGGWELAGKRLGVVGVGNVGSRVVAKATALGMEVLRNDPPLARRTDRTDFLDLDEVLQADIVTLHVPLTKAGRDKTFHLAGESFLDRMRDDAVFINTSRGPVADERALAARRKGGKLGGLVLDVYEKEPQANPEIIESADLATAHIAGYSLDGKVNGTFQVYEGACAFFGRPVEWNPQADMPSPELPELTLTDSGDNQSLVARAVRAVYDIEEDDRLLRGVLAEADTERGGTFDRLRKTYRIRREFHNTVVSVPAGRPALARKLEGIGFNVRRA